MVRYKAKETPEIFLTEEEEDILAEQDEAVLRWLKNILTKKANPEAMKKNPNAKKRKAEKEEHRVLTGLD